MFRKWYFTAFGLAAALGCPVTFGVLAFTALPPQPGTFLSGAIFAAFASFFWLLTWHSAVRIYPEGVIVDNLLTRHASRTCATHPYPRSVATIRSVCKC